MVVRLVANQHMRVRFSQFAPTFMDRDDFYEILIIALAAVLGIVAFVFLAMIRLAVTADVLKPFLK